jgi:hypothetical protein
LVLFGCNCSGGRRDPDVSAGEFGEDVEGAAACLAAVDREERIAAKSWAPARVRRHPETFCLILAIRRSLSTALLSKGTRGSTAKRR